MKQTILVHRTGTSTEVPAPVLQNHNDNLPVLFASTGSGKPVGTLLTKFSNKLGTFRNLVRLNFVVLPQSSRHLLVVEV